MAFAEVGTTASDFSLLNQRGEKVSLKDYRGKKNVVAVFLPQSHDPGLHSSGLWHTR